MFRKRAKVPEPTSLIPRRGEDVSEELLVYVYKKEYV